VAAALALAERDRIARTVQQRIPVAWRNVVSQPQRTEFEGDVTVEWYGGRDGYAVAVVGDRVDVDGPDGHVSLTRVPRFVDPADAVASGSLLAPMPGAVIRVEVEQGQQVEAGQPVLVLEAMKMQHTVTAPHAGTVTQIDVRPGAQVAAGEVLAVVEENDA
jgi:propionyl-CoA carboxylase alpha chain